MKNLNVEHQWIFLFIVFMTCVSGSPLFAQNNVGLFVEGSNNSFRYIMNYTDEQATSPANGYGLGLFVQKSITSGLSVTPSVKYSKRSFRIDQDQEGSNQMMSNISSSQLELAVLARISSSKGFMSPFFEVGPSYAYSLSQDSAPFGEAGAMAFDINDLSASNMNMIVGLGFSTKMGNSAVDFYLRYAMGVGNNYTGSDEGTVWRNNALVFGASFSLFSFGESSTPTCVRRKCR